ncbi:MAG: hypothetical protein ACREGA_01375 [Candidatus Saccharimonadales bacterium]
MADLKIDDIRAVIREEVAPLKTDVTELKSDVSTLKTDVADLKTDTSILKTDVAELKSDVSTLKTDVAELKTEQRRQGVLLEAMDDTLQTALENLSANLKVNNQVNDHEERIANIEADQDVIKSTVKLHTQQLKSN